MEGLKNLIQKYQTPAPKKSTAYEFQDFVLKTILEFDIPHPYDKRIWRYAKTNYSFLRGKVELLREQAEYRKESTKTYGRLLMWHLNKCKHLTTNKKYNKIELR